MFYFPDSRKAMSCVTLGSFPKLWEMDSVPRFGGVAASIILGNSYNPSQLLPFSTLLMIQPLFEFHSSRFRTPIDFKLPPYPLQYNYLLDTSISSNDLITIISELL